MSTINNYGGQGLLEWRAIVWRLANQGTLPSPEYQGHNAGRRRHALSRKMLRRNLNTWDARRKVILSMLREGEIWAAEVADALGVSKKRANHLLKALHADGQAVYRWVGLARLWRMS